MDKYVFPHLHNKFKKTLQSVLVDCIFYKNQCYGKAAEVAIVVMDSSSYSFKIKFSEGSLP